MRRFLLPLVVAVFACAPAAQAAPPVFFVDGRGWGHGIGMSQYGAYGFALREGRSYDWILAHYYRGTTLGTTSVGNVRILLAEGRSSVAVSSPAAFSVTDARGRTFSLAAGSHTLGPDLRVRSGGRWRTLASPARFTRGTAMLRHGGRVYRGQLVVHSSGGRLSVVNHLGLEPYLYGVVPDEVPPSWPAETLKAQAVAARSYAVVSRKTGGIFDLYADTRSQVYNGFSAEEPTTNAAVNATKGRVVRAGSEVAWTFFHSTSGGRTAAIQHVWATSPRSYLVSVPDPHDDLSPYHTWGTFRYTAKEFRTRLGSSAPAGALRDAVVARNASQRVSSVTVRGTLGTSSLAGTAFQSRFGLRSSWFFVRVLQLGGPTRVDYGRSARLTGVARGFGSTVTLERRIGTGAWQRVRDLTPAADGSVAVTVRPERATWYRLAAGARKGAGHRVQVATVVSAEAGPARRAIRGTVAPARAGVEVEVQRLVGGRWQTVARAQTAKDGTYVARLRVSTGSYRAQAKAGPGYLRGTSPVVKVAAG